MASPSRVGSIATPQQPAASASLAIATSTPSPLVSNIEKPSEWRRGPNRTSCAECRRLKLKCDGKFPCQQCTRRGYPSICPNDTLTTGQGHRMFWDQNALNRAKLTTYRHRIQELEAALKSAHSMISQEPHPLLLQYSQDPDRTDINYDVDDPRSLESQQYDYDGVPQNEEADNTYGSLSSNLSSGETRFFGHAAAGWYFLQSDETRSDQSNTADLWNHLPLELLSPDGAILPNPTIKANAIGAEDELRLLIHQLPPDIVVDHLARNAFSYGFIVYLPLPLDQYLTNVYDPLYHHAILIDHPLLPARLAMMFFVLAMGTLASSDRSVDYREAERYYQIGCAAVTHCRLVQAPSIEGIQALFLMIIYLRFSDKAGRRDMYNMGWSLSGLLMKLCQMVGLHSDPSHYELDPAETRRRVLLFGEIFMFDILPACMSGRPRALSRGYFDVQPLSDDDFGSENLYQTWQYKWALECLAPVYELLYADKPPLYPRVVQMSSHVQEYKAFTIPSTEMEQLRPDHELRTIQAHVSRAFKERLLLYLHRTFCLLAIGEHSDDPLACEYGPSVLTAYRSADRIISTYKDIQFLPQKYPINCRWIVAGQIYEAALLLGTLIIRCPHIHFTLEAYTQLHAAWSFCQDVNTTFETSVVCEKLAKTILMAKESITSHMTTNSVSGGNSEADMTMMLARLDAIDHAFPPLHAAQPDRSTVPVLSLPLQWSPYQELNEQQNFYGTRGMFALQGPQYLGDLHWVSSSIAPMPGWLYSVPSGPTVDNNPGAVQLDTTLSGWLVDADAHITNRPRGMPYYDDQEQINTPWTW